MKRLAYHRNVILCPFVNEPELFDSAFRRYHAGEIPPSVVQQHMGIFLHAFLFSAVLQSPLTAAASAFAGNLSHQSIDARQTRVRLLYLEKCSRTKGTLWVILPAGAVCVSRNRRCYLRLFRCNNTYLRTLPDEATCFIQPTAPCYTSSCAVASAAYY